MKDYRLYINGQSMGKVTTDKIELLFSKVISNEESNIFGIDINNNWMQAWIA